MVSLRKERNADGAEAQFGVRLREERQRLNLTQAAVATGAGVSVPSQVAYEQGTRTPDIHYLTNLERLGFDERYLRHGVRAERHATDALDWEFFKDVQSSVQKWCRGNQLEMDEADLTEITRLLYDQMIVDREVKPKALDRILTLVLVKK